MRQGSIIWPIFSLIVEKTFMRLKGSVFVIIREKEGQDPMSAKIGVVVVVVV